MLQKNEKTRFVELSAKIESGIDLNNVEASSLFGFLRTESDVARLTSLLEAWIRKGYSVEEIASCAGVLRREVRRVECSHEVFIDVVGTGGSRSKTFNVSTAAAFAVSGAGLPVAKHGNRAASSRTGSADAIAELGIELSASADTAARSLEKHAICFMFAPHFHNLTKELAEARRAVGRPTIFNLLGPAANPAGAPFQLIGIWDGSKAREYGEALRKLGTKRTWIVHGKDGLDEITLNGATTVTEVTENGIDEFEISPSDFGLREASIDGLSVRTPSESVDVILEVLNCYDDGPARDLVAMNAGAALYIAGLADDLKDGLAMAEESIDSGEALEKLRLLAEEARK
ncbi:MAG: anthranilate phosphoribosyltransferase [Acidobacteriota bacterium]|nr:MAG: anthranilate phosphoribosyltransferase [Acidobacteriota bacterium]